MMVGGKGSLLGWLLVAQGFIAQGQSLPGIPSRVLESVQIKGGSRDDQAFSLAAMGMKAGDPVGEEGFLLALAAVRATDRFKDVQGRLEPGVRGMMAHVRLEPWPEIQKREIHGKVPKSLLKGLFPGMHLGGRAGDLRLARWQSGAEEQLKEAGYPAASVRITRQDGGARLVIEVETGAPALVRTMDLEGDFAPYTLDRIRRASGIQPGKSIWTETLQRQALAGIRNRMVKDQRFEGTAKFLWDGVRGHLTLTLRCGPVVRLRREGEWSIWWKDISELVPLARAGSYSPELLDEGDRRILGFLRDKGYLNAKVSHRRDILRGTAEQPLEVVVTFNVDPGVLVRIHDLRFERNEAFTDSELHKAAGLPSRMWFLGAPAASPELMGALEDRIKSFYWSRGYPEVSLRRPPLERKNGEATLLFQVREGSNQVLEKVILDLPEDPSWQPWMLAEALPLIFTNRLIMEPGPEENTRVYRSDRPATEGVTGKLEVEAGIPGTRRFTLAISRPIPLIKADLALVFTSLRQKLASLGVQRPVPRLYLEQGAQGQVLRLEVPDQPRLTVKRLVVQGSDYTRAKAVLREAELAPGIPLDGERLSQAQRHLGDLGAFQRVDLVSLMDERSDGGNLPWREGDLLLRTDERPPWVLNSAFGYDKSHGYHIGAGAQRRNFLGMGRTLDFGVRAGDTTIQNPTLRKWFPTGDFNRSVDSFSVGYTDPWFLPGALENILQDRTQYHLEAAYIEETQAAFLAHRRRVLNELDWKVGDAKAIRLGHRYERTDIKANLEGIELRELFQMAGVPGAQTIISAPFLQITRDKRDNPIDPKRGTFFLGRLELANQLFGTGSKYSFAKLELRQQWHWSLGRNADFGVVMAAARLGVARPTAASVEDLPLAERFFAGGPFTVRGVEADFLGPVGTLGIYETINGTTIRTGSRMIPLGGQGLVVFNLEYRFPLFGSQTVWGGLFADSGQVYARLNPEARAAGDGAPFPPLRTTLGFGLTVKLGIPIKFEYAADLKRILGKPRTQQEKDTQLKGLLISAGYQF